MENKIYKLNIELLNSVIPAMRKEEVRFNICGVYIHDKDGMRVYVATDGHKLFVAKELTEGELLPEKGIIVKFKKEIGKSKLDYCEMVIVDDETVVIRTEKEKMALDIINGEYPSYEKVINSENTESAKQYFVFDPDLLKDVRKFIGKNNYLNVPKQDNVRSPAMWRVVDEYNKQIKIAVIMPLHFNV